MDRVRPFPALIQFPKVVQSAVMSLQSRAALLTLPGWSNIDSWLHVIRSSATLNAITDLLSSNIWVLAKLRTQNSRGIALEKLGVRFVIWFSNSNSYITSSFRTAVVTARFILLVQKLVPRSLSLKIIGFACQTRIFGLGVIVTNPKNSAEFAKVWPVVMTDINSICSLSQPRDLQFASLLVDSNLFSLYHGTLDIEAKDSPNHELLKLFSKSRKTIFATTPRQVEKYKMNYEVPEKDIRKVSPPRHENYLDAGSFPEAGKVGGPNVLLMTRSPAEFESFSYLASVRALTSVISSLGRAGSRRLYVMSHPNEGRIGVYVRTLLGFLFALPLNVSVHLTDKSVDEYRDIGLALTWFTGLTVDLAILGVPAYELRSGEPPIVGPPNTENEPFDMIHALGLCQRILSETELQQTLLGLSASDVVSRAREAYQREFFQIPKSTESVAREIEELVER